MSAKTVKNNKREWRCPVCERLLARVDDAGLLEVESRNGQVVSVFSHQREVRCKCGSVITVSGSLTEVLFKV